MSTLYANVQHKTSKWHLSPEDKRTEDLEFLCREHYLEAVQKIKDYLGMEYNGTLIARIESGLERHENWVLELLYDCELTRKELAAMQNDLSMLEDLYWQDR